MLRIVWFQKISIPPPRRELEIPEGWGGSKAQENPEERGGEQINYFPEGQLRFIPMKVADKVRKLLLTEFVDLYCGIKLV